MKRRLLFATLVCFVLPAMAAVAPEDIARLGKDLTPVGAEKLGNGNDIPAWRGGLPLDKKHKPGAFHADPFAADQPRFRISAANVAEHRSRLTDGQVALLQRFPDLYFEVYPTRRSASYPDYVYEADRKSVV